MLIRDKILLPAVIVLLSSYAPLGFTQAASTAAAEPADTGLEEVVITAQKRTEKLSDTPVAASVISADTIANDNITDVSELNKLVPSLNMDQTVNGRVPIALRGFVSLSNEGAVGIASGVAVEVDGVPVPSDSTAGNAIYDAEDVEVLKGPQGTLGGRAAAAGVVNTVTKGPSDVFTGSATVEYTTDQEKLLNVFFAGPLNEKVDFSLAAYSDEKYEPIKNLYNGQQTTQDLDGGRAKLLFKVTDNFDIKVTQYIGLTETAGADFTYAYLPPGSSLFYFLPPGPIPAVGSLPIATAMPGVTPSWDNEYVNSINTTQDTNRHQNDTNLDLTYRIGEYTVTSTTAYQHETANIDQDLFLNAQHDPFLAFLGVPFNNEQNLIYNTRQMSEELRLVSPSTGFFTYVGGLFYSDTDVNLLTTRNLVINFNNNDEYSGTQSSAAYFRGTWHLNSTWSLLAGLRYNYDNIEYGVKQVLVGSGCVFCDSFGSNESSTAVGDLTLQMHFADSSMAYLTYAHGYSPPAYNTAAVLCPGTMLHGAPSVPQPICTTVDGVSYTGASFNGSPAAPGLVNQPLPVVAAESINHYELGLKGTYFDRRLSLDAAVFDTLYNNFQINTYQTQLGAQSLLEFLAAGSAYTRGVELNAEALPARDTRVSLGLAYIDAKFSNFNNAQCWTGEPTSQCPNGTQNLSGTAIPQTPKFKGVIALSQRFVVSDSSDLVFGGDYTYRTSTQMLADADPYSIMPAFGIANFHLTYALDTGAKSKFTATAFVDNAFNHFYATDVEDFFSGLWGAGNGSGPGNGPAVLQQPARDAVRYGGLKLNYSW
jgi:iron complex outermembrane recepter protein